MSVLPVWFFAPVAHPHPLRAGSLSVIPFIGALGLIAGTVLGIVQRSRTLFLFFFPFLVSECYVAIAALFQGQVHGQALLVSFCIFTFVQIVLIGYVVFRSGEPGSRHWRLLFSH
jgi:hypothetical protein